MLAAFAATLDFARVEGLATRVRHRVDVLRLHLSSGGEMHNRVLERGINLAHTP